MLLLNGLSQEILVCRPILRRPIVCIILFNSIIFIILYIYAVNEINQSTAQNECKLATKRITYVSFFGTENVSSRPVDRI